MKYPATLTINNHAPAFSAHDINIWEDTTPIPGTTTAVQSPVNPPRTGISCLKRSRPLKNRNIQCQAHGWYNCVDCENKSRRAIQKSQCTGQYAPGRSQSRLSNFTFEPEKNSNGLSEALTTMQQQDTAAYLEPFPDLQPSQPLARFIENNQQRTSSTPENSGQRLASRAEAGIQHRQRPTPPNSRSILAEGLPNPPMPKPKPRIWQKWCSTECEPVASEPMAGFIAPRRNSETRDPDFFCLMVKYRRYRGEVSPTRSLEGLREYVRARCKRRWMKSNGACGTGANVL